MLPPVNGQPMKFAPIGAASLLALLPVGASAQLLQRYLPQSVGPYEADPTMAVLQQGGADYRAAGVRIDDFVINPEITESDGYAQNPLGLAQGARSSPTIDTSAAVSLHSDWSRNSLSASASFDNSLYPNVHTADTNTSTVFLGGTIDIGDNQLSLGAGHVSANLGATDVLAFGLAAPVPYQTNDVRAEYTQVLGPLSITPGIDLTSFTFGRTVVGTEVVNDTGLDKNQIAGSVVGNYELAAGRNVVVALRETSAQFQHGGSAGNYLASSILAGLDYVASDLFRYDILIGFEHRGFNGPIHSINTPLVEGAVLYSPNRLTTITAQFTREIADPTYNITNNLTYTSARLIGDYAFRRNVLLQGRAGLDLGAADGTSGSRLDTTFGAGVTWLLTRRVSLAANYDFVWAQGSGAGNFVTATGASINNAQLSYSTATLTLHLQL